MRSAAVEGRKSAMVDMDKLATLVNSFGSALVSVGQEVGLQPVLNKGQIAQGVKVENAIAASLIGIVGGGVQGTAVVMLNKDAFEGVISCMSGGMIAPSLEDPVAMSVIGELSNMVSGRALIQSAIPGVDVTPPQLLAGENIRNVPNKAPGIRCFTLPFSLGNLPGTVYLIVSFHVGS
jgi:chemotaxis protein CheX